MGDLQRLGERGEARRLSGGLGSECREVSDRSGGRSRIGKDSCAQGELAGGLGGFY